MKLIALKMSGSGDMKSSGDMTKASSVGLLYLLFNQVEIASVVLTKASSVDLLYLPFNQVEIASVGNKSQDSLSREVFPIWNVSHTIINVTLTNLISGTQRRSKLDEALH